MNIADFYNQLLIDIQAIAGHAELSDADLAAAINAKTISGTRPIPSAELIAWAAARGKLVGIQTAAATPDHTARNAAIAIVAMMSRDSDSFDSTNPDHQTILASLVGASLLSTGAGDTDTTSLTLRYTTSKPYVFTTYGVSSITQHDIAHARSIE